MSRASVPRVAEHADHRACEGARVGILGGVAPAAQRQVAVVDGDLGVGTAGRMDHLDHHGLARVATVAVEDLGAEAARGQALGDGAQPPPRRVLRGLHAAWLSDHFNGLLWSLFRVNDWPADWQVLVLAYRYAVVLSGEPERTPLRGFFEDGLCRYDPPGTPSRKDDVFVPLEYAARSALPWMHGSCAFVRNVSISLCAVSEAGERIVTRRIDETSSPMAFFGGALRRARMAAGMSQEHCGRELGYSGDLVGKIETGERSRPPTSPGTATGCSRTSTSSSPACSSSPAGGRAPF